MFIKYVTCLILFFKNESFIISSNVGINSFPSQKWKQVNNNACRRIGEKYKNLYSGVVLILLQKLAIANLHNMRCEILEVWLMMCDLPHDNIIMLRMKGENNFRYFSSIKKGGKQIALGRIPYKQTNHSA